MYLIEPEILKNILSHVTRRPVKIFANCRETKAVIRLIGHEPSLGVVAAFGAASLSGAVLERIDRIHEDGNKQFFYRLKFTWLGIFATVKV